MAGKMFVLIEDVFICWQ